MKNLFDEIKKVTTSVPWIKLFKENNITEKQILENIEQIFKSNAQERIEHMIRMYRNNDKKMSIELFKITLEKFYKYNWDISFERMIDIISTSDFVTWAKSLDDKDAQKYKSILSFYVNKALPGAMDVLNKLFSTDYKVDRMDIQEMMDHNHVNNDPFIAKFIKDWLSTEVKPEMLNVLTKAIHYDILTPQEFVRITKDSTRIIEVLSKQSEKVQEMVKAINDDKVLLDEFYNNLINNKNINLTFSDIKNLKNIFIDEEVYDKFVDAKTPLIYKLKHKKDLDWNYYDSIIEELKFDERKALFSRVDVPVWFLTKYQAVLVHLQLSNSRAFEEYLLNSY